MGLLGVLKNGGGSAGNAQGISEEFTSAEQAKTVNFPIEFPSNALSALATVQRHDNNGANVYSGYCDIINKKSMYLTLDYTGGSTGAYPIFSVIFGY